MQMNREKVIRELTNQKRFVRAGSEEDKTLDSAIALLKEQKGLMLALEQSNAVNGYLNAEVERLNGLLKEQEKRIETLETLRRIEQEGR